MKGLAWSAQSTWPEQYYCLSTEHFRGTTQQLGNFPNSLAHQCLSL